MHDPTEDLKCWVAELSGQGLEARKDGAIRLRKLATKALAHEDFDQVLELTSLAKQLKAPLQGVDQMRAMAWLFQGRYGDAREALKEELRWFSSNQAAQDLMHDVEKRLQSSVAAVGDQGYQRLFEVIHSYTMLSQERLYALYSHASRICRQGLVGNFVECGVAGGGSSGLLASVISAHNMPTEVRLFCCDSFDGLPEPTQYDTHNGSGANDIGWGTGTCSAPESSVQELCAVLGVADRIQIVKGYFEETLAKWSKAMEPIAFLHMDGDWYSSTRAILDNLYDKLLPGAYIQVDDYGYWDGCRKALHEFEQERSLSFELHRIDGSGVFFTKPE